MGHIRKYICQQSTSAQQMASLLSAENIKATWNSLCVRLDGISTDQVTKTHRSAKNSYYKTKEKYGQRSWETFSLYKRHTLWPYLVVIIVMFFSITSTSTTFYKYYEIAYQFWVYYIFIAVLHYCMIPTSKCFKTCVNIILERH
jgi:ABC-type multidrug transport system permease subunit